MRSTGSLMIGRRQTTGIASFVLLAWVSALCSPGHAGQPESFIRIGTLGAVGGSGNPSRRWDGFRQGLRELGYTEGKNIVIESRSVMGRLEELDKTVTELVRLKVAVIVTGGASATRAAKKASSTIPIVMARDSDPGRERVRRQSRAPGRQYHRTIEPIVGDERETLGTT
jgi:ABC-type uncharacterized transport system substrate-binding protein